MRALAQGIVLGTMLSAGPVYAEDAPGPDADSIIVTGQWDATDTIAATKSATPIAEVPQSISVISSADLRGLGLQNLNQALRYVAGVTTEQRGSSAEVYDQFKLRGFDAPVFLDGLRLAGGSYLSPQIDVSRLDRIEIVKGPASVLYGQSGPGGLVAQSSKLPVDKDFYGSVEGTYGTYDLYRVDGDVGGKVGSDVLWRLYGSVNGADTQQRFAKRERQTISGAVTLGANSSTDFTVLAAYSHDPHNGAYSVFPASGTFIDNPNGRLSTKFDGGERDNRISREQAALTYIFNHDFGQGWHFRSSGRYQYGRSRLGLVYTSGGLIATDPTSQTFARASYSSHEQANTWTFDNQVHGTFATGPLKHDLLVGTDRQVNRARQWVAFGGGTPLNGYAPVYGTMPVPMTPDEVPDNFGIQHNVYRQRQQSVYAQDEISWGGLRVVLSGRQDWARVVSANTVQKSEKFTYRAGALYKTSIGVAPYVSYSTSFEPQSGLVARDDGTSGAAKPSLGKQIEAGIKYTVPDTEILLTGAWFRIEQTNLLTSIPNSNLSVQTGKVRSQGVEFEATAPLPYDFNAKATFSRQKVRTIEDGNPANIGRGILGVGRGGATFNLEWAPKQGALAGLGVGGGVRYVDHVYAGGYSVGGVETFRGNTPSYTLFDALVRYDVGKASPGLEGLTLAVNATNLFDKKYLTTCYLDYAWCWYGNRRTVQATIGYSW